jgi:glucose-6-phosphate dehydrogenase assembly protein OpcA
MSDTGATAPEAFRMIPDRSMPLDQIERELAGRVKAMQSPGEAPLWRSCLSNLVIYCDGPEQAEAIAETVPQVVAIHPARVLLLVADSQSHTDDLQASISVRAHPAGVGRKIYSEQVTLHATGHYVERLSFVVRGLLIGDLPINLWWAVPQPPSLASVLLTDLVEHVQQVVFDSVGWPQPARGVVSTANWLTKTERTNAGQYCWRVASDLNWRRLKPWRRLLGQALDPATAPCALETLSEVTVEHGPHAVVRAWELVSWLASRLGWKLVTGKTQPGVEISWSFQSTKGPIKVRLRRLEQGAPTIHRLRLTCRVKEKPTVLSVFYSEEHRLAVQVEGAAVAERTMTVREQPLADLVGRQLSDRERDPVFAESMAVAKVLAQSLLG